MKSSDVRPPLNPHRSPIPWKDDAFYDEQEVEKELRRIFDICHTCRRCFNLCGLFPRLFTILDSQAVDGDVEKISSAHIKDILPSCTLCDLCFMAKCPYVPPHPWAVDLPRAILRYRAIQSRKFQMREWIKKTMAHVDSYAPLAMACSSVSNAISTCSATRVLMEKTVGIHRKAELPAFRHTPMIKWTPPKPNSQGVAYGEKLVVYITCLNNYYHSRTAVAACAILAYYGVEVVLSYPGCCGMPLWEQGCLPDIAQKAEHITEALHKDMYSAGATAVLSLTPSCTLMLREQFPALLSKNTTVHMISENTWDLCEYLVKFLKDKKITPQSTPFPQGISLHNACHVRAQNTGSKAQELLHYMVDTPVKLFDMCSGHGGMWGFHKEHFEESMKVGAPLVHAMKEEAFSFIASECPLALTCIRQGFQKSSSSQKTAMPKPIFAHPVEIFATSLSLFPLEFLQHA